jgi:TetR/AcrR family transcriptional regulator, regulator of mycofactocin system
LARDANIQLVGGSHRRVVPSPASQPGRPPVTSRAAIERVAFSLFLRRGFDQVRVEEIAAAAGIGRRTFFRYFQSKNDVVWGDFHDHLEQFRGSLSATGPDVPLARALVDSIVAFNTYAEDEAVQHRQRMELILTVPELQAYSTLQFAAWRTVVAEFVASRTGGRPDDIEPQVVARTALGAAMAAYDRWLQPGEMPLVDIMREALELWSRGLELRASR